MLGLPLSSYKSLTVEVSRTRGLISMTRTLRGIYVLLFLCECDETKNRTVYKRQNVSILTLILTADIGSI